MRILNFLKKQNPSLIVLAALLLVVALGLADYITGPELFFLQFYLVPVFLIAWIVGEKAAAGISIASAVCWFIDEAGRTRSSVVYSNVGVKLFVFLLFTRMALALKNALEREKEAEEENIRREIEIARQVQERLLPQVVPPMKTLDYVGVCKPVFGVGGDYYDFLAVEQGRLAIAVGDVAGKGISSALLMATFKGMLHSHAFHNKREVGALISDLNRYMYPFTDNKRFVTLFYGLYDECSRKLRYVNAGHNPPLIFRDGANGPLKLASTGLVIGLFPNINYHEQAVQLYAGDTLVCFTDGVTEAMNPEEEEFNEERLIDVVQMNRKLTACELRDTILSELNRFAGSAMQRDDETLVIVRVL